MGIHSSRAVRVLAATALFVVLSAVAAGMAVAGPITISDLTPAPDSGVTELQPTISVFADSNIQIYADRQTYIKLDGKKQRTYIVYEPGDNTAATVYCVPYTPLSDGVHTVEVRVKDYYRATASTSWSFVVGGPPVLAEPTPAPLTTVTTDEPSITARVTSGAGGVVASALVDGSPALATFDPVSNLVSVHLASPLQNDATHDVTVTATNDIGLSDELEWGFYVLTQTRMPDTTAGQPCQSCHPTYPTDHSSDDCDACHGPGSPVGGDYSPPAYGPHPEENETYLSDCEACHFSAYPTVPMHTAAADTYHSAGAEADPCKPCHVSDLLAEHYYREETNDCYLCHQSARGEVQAAILAGDTSCLACHDADHGGSHTSDIANQFLTGTYPNGSYGPYVCTGCHVEGVVFEHARGSSSSAPDGCDACHPTPRDTLTPQWDLGCVQGGCHPDGSATQQHGMQDLQHMPLSINADCIACHVENDLGAIHISSDTSCFICHSDSSVPDVRDCVTCHPEKTDPHGYDPAAHTSDVGADTISGGYPSGVGYGPIECQECHVDELGPEHDRPTSSSAPNGCGNCHPSPVDSLTPSWALGCVQGGCHPAGSPTEQHQYMDASHELTDTGPSQGCIQSDCHDQGDAGAVHLIRSTSGCLYCHSTIEVPTTVVCLDCHTGHADLAQVHAADEPGGLTWANNGAYAPCTQCHYLDLRTEHAKPTSGSLGCGLPCHGSGGAVEGLPGPWDKKCDACHTTYHADYDAEHYLPNSDCSGCHSATGGPVDGRDHLSCGVAAPNLGTTSSCHTGPDYVPTVRIADYGFYWCRQCHPNE